jgi:hypothetical protein
VVNYRGLGADKGIEMETFEDDAYQTLIEDPPWMSQEGPPEDAPDADGDPDEDRDYERMVSERLIANG